MAIQTERDGGVAYEANRDYVLAVLARRCGWLDADEREAALHDAYVVLLEKQRASQLDPRSMPEPQLRAYLVQTAIHKALDQGKRAERKRSQPFGDTIPVLPDPHPGPDEHAEASQHGAQVRELIAELPERQQAIVKLRFFFDRTPDEIQDYLRITKRTYRRQLERAMRTIATRYELVREGRFCDERRELIIAYVAGTAEPDRVRLVREHLASCRGCASWAAELRAGASEVAAALPIPALALSGGALERSAEALETARGALADSVSAAKHHALALATRADPSNAAFVGGARPGALAATVAGCVAIAGGTATYCAVEGVPEPLRSALGLSRDEPRERERDRSRPIPAEPARLVTPPPAPQPAPAPAPEPPADERLAPAPAPAPPPPPPPPPDEFGFEASGGGDAATAPPPAAPRSDPAPPPSPPGEFDP